MDHTPWYLAAALGFVVLHVVVAAYLYRRASAAEEPVGPDGPRRPDPGQSSREERIPCSVCGASNDPTYRFCWRCISDLTAAGTPGNRRDTGKRLGS
jgi:hypothetical protein